MSGAVRDFETFCKLENYFDKSLNGNSILI